KPRPNLNLTSNKSGYNLAKMAFAIVLAPEAVEDLQRLKANVRADIRAALATHLRHGPKKVSRSRIKRLRGLRKPRYRLRIGEVRIFYDVTGTTVEILAIVAKLEADSWLAQFAKPATRKFRSRSSRTISLGIFAKPRRRRSLSRVTESR